MGLVGSFKMSGNSKLMTQTKVEQRVAGLAGSSSESLLIDGCIQCIEQCEQILEMVSQEVYVDTSRGSSSIAAHIRHILDRFSSFFCGLPAAAIDYDKRKRDKEIEHNLEAACFALATIARRVEQLKQAPFAKDLIIVKESVLPSSPAVEISSTIEREMMGLITHSIPHLSVIALQAKAFGYPLNDDFGKAASTLVYERA